jgi:23S rRNA (guanosine2251-2'-O)-methyltransferase
MLKSNFQSKKNIVAGRNPVIEALKQGSGIDKILLSKQASGVAIDELRALAKDLQVPIQYVPIQKINGLTNVQHQGVIAFKTSITYYNTQQVIDLLNDKGEVPLFLILDGVTDVRNIGAIARNALCFGAQAIIIPDKGVGAMQEDAIKASAGALEKIFICREPSLLNTVEQLKLNGLQVVCSSLKGQKQLHELDFTIPTAVILGAEGAGAQAYMQKASTHLFKIPMSDAFDSLNVSVATGIILHHAFVNKLHGK